VFDSHHLPNDREPVFGIGDRFEVLTYVFDSHHLPYDREPVFGRPANGIRDRIGKIFALDDFQLVVFQNL
jgi:hypothetical protein